MNNYKNYFDSSSNITYDRHHQQHMRSNDNWMNNNNMHNNNAQYPTENEMAFRRMEEYNNNHRIEEFNNNNYYNNRHDCNYPSMRDNRNSNDGDHNNKHIIDQVPKEKQQM